ncbi:MAG: hypothetical protein K6G61_00865 [Solobacterium sp.]|nr:hypothetical protein [Solobacterium sp.]
MTIQEYNPIRLTCPSCGAPVRYEIRSGTYRCANCGTKTPPVETYKRIESWRKLRQSQLRSDADLQKAVFWECPGCGARVIARKGEATGSCSFCGGTLVRRDYTEKDTFPEMIIPFAVTEEEAKDKMKAFILRKLHGKKKREALKHLDEMEGYYLPYQFVRGPITCKVDRDVSQRVYTVAGYVNELAVNTSRQLTNEVLDACEPFEWEDTVPFSFGYIAGHRVKMQDISDKDVSQRVYREVEDDFLPEVKKVMRSKSVDVTASVSDLEQLPVLLPMYFVKSGDLLASCNGQTGACALTFHRTVDRGRWWWLEPLLTAVILGLVSFLLLPSYELTFYVFAAAGLVAWTAFDNIRTSHMEMIIYRDRREDPKDTVPVFREMIDGKEENVDIRFYTPGRLIGILLRAVLFNVLPVLLAVFFLWASGRPLSELQPGYISLWLVLSVPFTFIFWIAYMRRDIFDNPLIFLIREDGSLKRIRRKKAGLGVLSFLWDAIRGGDMPIGFFLLLVGLPVLMFVMSVYLMMGG